MPSLRNHSRTAVCRNNNRHVTMQPLSKKDFSFVARMAVLLLAANSVSTTRAWTTGTTSPSTMGKIGTTATTTTRRTRKNSSCRPKNRNRSSSTSCVRMTNGSYEEQFAAFAKQQKEQMQQEQEQEQEQQVPQPIRQYNQIDDTTSTPNSNPIILEDPNTTANNDAVDVDVDDPNTIRSDSAIPPFENPNLGANTLNDSDSNRNRKVQEELEMAFLEFISCIPTKNAIPGVQPPSQQEESQPQNDPEYEMYTDVSTSLDFAAFPQHTANVATIDGELELESISASESLSIEPTATTTTSPEDNDSPTFAVEDNVAAASKRPSLSSSTSYLENLGSESTSGSFGDTSNSESGVECDSDVDVDAPKSASTDNSEDDNYYTIEVRVETTFPTGITVEGAKLGWLEFCWSRGGGIMVPATPSDKPPSASKPNSIEAVDAPTTIKFGSDEEANNNEEKQELESSIKSIPIPAGIPFSRELIVPLGLKQKLVSSTSTLDEIQATTIRRDVVTYKTTQRGFFCRDMIQDTHEGRVEFIGASYTSTRMIWTVKFQVEQDEERWSGSTEATTKSVPTYITKNQETTANDVMEFASTTKTMVEGYSKQFMDSNPKLKTMMSKGNIWGSWSQFQLKTASQNLIAYLDNSADSMPVLEHTETLPIGVSPREAMEAWYDYYWKNGGGAKLVRASPKEGRDTRWVLPSGLEEELVSLEYDHPVSESGVVGVDGHITTETEIAKAVYKVNNPNLLTYPVHYHRATVRFVRDVETNPTQLFWKVKVKPYRKFLGGGVLFWTKNGIVLAARNLRNYLEFQQLQKRETELQAQLERLRMQNPSSSSSGSTTTINDNNDDQQPLEGIKPLDEEGRRTLSIFPPRAIDDRATIEIDTSTHAVNQREQGDV